MTLKVGLVTAVVALAVSGAVTGAAVASAPTVAPADLAVSGFVAGGEHAVETSHPVVFVFSLTDQGPAPITSSADLNTTAVHNGTVIDQLCITPDGSSLNSDGTYCEPGGLRVGQASRMTLVVQPSATASGQSLSVTVCGSNESGVPDRLPGNNCRTLTVGLE